MKKYSVLWNILGLFVKNPGAISAGLVRFFKLGALAGIASLMAQGFWDEGLTPIGLMLVMAGLGALEKLLKEKWGVGLALALAFILSAQPAQAEDVKILELKASDFSVGGGSMFGEESMTFDLDSAFAAVHWHGVALFGPAGSTGVGVELHPASFVDDGNGGTQSVGNADWRFWSLNRLNMKTLQLPGEVWEMIYIGSDLLLAEGGGNDYTGDFDARFVFGLNEGPVQIEFYMFEKYRPISFALMYRF